MKELDLSIIIVNYNTEKFLEQCLKSIYAHTREINFEIIVVDNNSHDQSTAMVKEEFPQVKLIEQVKNVGFAKAVNEGIKEAKARYILSLNNDTVILPGALEKMIKFMESNPEAAAAGPKILNPDGTPQLSCRRFPTLITAFFNRRSLLTRLFPNNKFSQKYLMSDCRHDIVQEVDWISGAYLIMRRKTIEEVGLMDEDYFLYCEEVDWCYRAKEKGCKIYYFPDSQIIHYGGDKLYSGRRIIEHHRSMYKFYKKHYSKFKPLDWFVGVAIILRAGVILSLSLMESGTKRKHERMEKTV